MIEIALYGLIAFLVVAALMPLAIKLAVAHDFYDMPGGRKIHDTPVPPIGGLLIIPTFLIVYGFTSADWARDWSLYVAVISLLIMGALDDRMGLSAWLRFGVQIAVSVLVVVFGACKLTDLGFLFSPDNLFELGYFSIPFSIAAVALLVNAINLMDGLDGLAGGQSFIIFAMLFAVAVIAGQAGWMTELSPMLGALLGFLVYNMRSPVCKQARVFLGDAGTLSLGMCLAWFSIRAANDHALGLEAISVAWFLAVPIMDECAQFYRRVREGRHPFSADRGHFHHHFIDAGFNVGHATPSILCIALILGGWGYGALALGMPQSIVTISWIVTLLGHMALIAHGRGFYTKLLSR